MLPVDIRLARYLSGGLHAGYRTMLDGFDRGLTGHIVHDGDAPIALQMCAPMVFEPVPGKRNVLVSMYESHDMPADAIAGVRAADVLVVPSYFCLRIFRQFTDAPIYVVPLGVEPATVPERRFSAPFTWLWVGAMNFRKGWPVLAATWDRYFARMGGAVRLVVKTTLIDGSGVRETHGNFVFDSRSLTREDLAALYRDAHAFAYPTMGEGFGLGLAEALAAGLPSVATDYGGHLDFARGRCRLVRPKVQRLEPAKEHPSTAPDGRYAFATLSVENLARDMLWVMQHYDAALAMGQRAAKAMRSYTWDAAAQKLAAILRKEARRAERVAA